MAVKIKIKEELFPIVFNEVFTELFCEVNRGMELFAGFVPLPI
jgi:hypothetical protein